MSRGEIVNFVADGNPSAESWCNFRIKQITLKLGQLRRGCVMASNSEEEESLEAAVAGIPRIADAVAANPDGVRAKVLEAVENSYRQAAHDLGYDEERVQSWVSTIMLRLQAELERRESAKQKVLEALQEELLQAEPRPDNTVQERGKKPRAMAGRTRRRSSRQPNLKAIGSGSL